jgi:hypothetical protein
MSDSNSGGGRMHGWVGEHWLAFKYLGKIWLVPIVLFYATSKLVSALAAAPIRRDRNHHRDSR